MKSIINLLPENISNQIAAGEVVQRPASVVKELLENSIDANSKTIKLILKDSGKTLIQVIDNGKGMNEVDARMSFERHATSKIKTTEDIFNINTKGFRGEALASIGAVSQVELKTKVEGEEIGTEILIEGGDIKKQGFTQTPKGTIFSVKNLFFNTPARRKFLKSDNVEYKYILDEFFRVSMAHPEISFYLENNNNVVFNLKGSSLKERIEKLIGKRLVNNLIKIEEQNDFAKIYGFVGTPQVAKRVRGEQYIFANNRFIKHYSLNHAVSTAFFGTLKEGTFPSFFIFIEIDTNNIDINIHPTKTEVKFDKEEIIYSMIKSSVKYAIGKFGTSSIDFNINPEIEKELIIKKKNVPEPKIKVDRNFNPFNLDTNSNKNKDSWKILYSGINDAIKDENKESKDIFQTDIFKDDTTNSIIQYKKKYLVFLDDNGINIINQRLAHIRVLYEGNKKNIERKLSLSKQLLYPYKLDITKQEKGIFSELENHLNDMGFGIKLEDDKIVISSIPNLFNEMEIKDFIQNILEEKNNFGDNIKESIINIINIKYSESKAIQAGKILSKEEMINLKNDLFNCDNFRYSPKGDKIYFTLSEKDIFNKLN